MAAPNNSVEIPLIPGVVVTATAGDIHPVSQGGVTKQETNAQIAAYLQSLTWPVASGGTGLISYAIGDMLYASGATALSKLADVATGNALLSGGIGVAPAWGKVGLTTHVSGILPLANGGGGTDLSATGGVNQIVRQNSAGGVFTVSVLAAGDLPNTAVTPGSYGAAASVATFTVDQQGRLTAAATVAIAISATAITSGALALARGGTHADLSATGGAGQYLKQAGVGADITVGTIPATDLTYSGLTTGQPLRATGATTAAFGALDLNNTNATVNALLVARGGTAIASYAVGDLLYADGATSLAKLADVATGNALISGGVTTAPSWGKIGLTTHVSGILPSANGGTGVNNAGTITNASNTIITGGGTIALAGFTLTVPATLTVAGLGIANVFTLAQTAERDAIAATSTDGLILTNATAAAAGVQQWSPRLRLTGQGWKTNATAASQTVDWIAELIPVQAAANPSAQLQWSTQINGGGYTKLVSFVDTGFSTGYIVQLGTTAGTGIGLGGTNQGVLGLYGGNATEVARVQSSNGIIITSANMYHWTNGSGFATRDLALARNGAGVLEVNNSTAGQWGSIKAGVRDAATNTIVDGLTLGHQTSGTQANNAAGLGIGLQLNINDTTTPDTNAFRLTSELVVAAHASYTTRTKFNVYGFGGAHTALTLEDSGAAPMMGVLGAAAVVRQIGGENLTNNVTVGGTTGQIDDFVGTLYSTDAATIRNDIYQLARMLKQDHDALRLYGFLT